MFENVYERTVVCIIYGYPCGKIKIRKIGDKKFSVSTACSIFRSISRVMGVINSSVFGGLHHLRMRLQPDKNQKNRRQKVFRFYC